MPMFLPPDGLYSEALFTSPRPDCPHPEWWRAPDSDTTEWEVSQLIGGLVVALQPDYVIETGSCWGQTTEVIGRALAHNGHGRAVTMEVWGPKADHVRARCEGLPVEVLAQDSLSFAPTSPVDFVFFDSLMELRPREYRLFEPWFTDRTVVAFHDTGPHWPTRGYITEHIPELTLVDLPTPRGVSIARYGR